MSQLVTGEAVAIDLRPARLVSRTLAAVIDIAIEIVVVIVLFEFFIPLSIDDPDLAIAFVLLVIVGAVVGYPAAFETLWRGRTPGKAALGIRVVRDDGGPIRFRHALTRALFNIVERPGVTFGSAAVICSLLSMRGKRIGDLVAGTFVLQERLPRQQMTRIFMPPQLAPWAATLDLSRMPDDLALAVRGFLSRAGELRPDARDRLGAELSSAVASCTSPPPPVGTPGWAYLAAVIAERRRRDEQRNAALPRATPWQPPPPAAGWGPPPSGPGWSASAPPLGSPPPVGPPPPVGSPPAVGAPPRLPGAPSPQWGPAPVPPSAPPAPPPPPLARSRRARSYGDYAPDGPDPAAAPEPAAPPPAARRRATPPPPEPSEPSPPDGGFAPPS